MNILREFWWGFSKKRREEAEQKLLKGEIEGMLEFSNTTVSGSENDTIHSISMLKENSRTLVIVPGFGSGSAMYYRMIRELSPHYSIHVVDMRGMGSRAEAEEFLVEGLEEWRKQNLNTKFVLCGHSLGGYVAAKYAIKYQENLTGLVLLSPAGVAPKPANFEEYLKTRIGSMGPKYRLLSDILIKDKFYQTLAKRWWSPGKSPMVVPRRLGRACKLGLRLGLYFFTDFNKKEREAVREYMYHVLMDKECGEYTMAHLLEPGGFGVDPLINHLDKIRVPTLVFYGDGDWMRHTLYDVKLDYTQIPHSSHHINLDNPKDLCSEIVKQLDHALVLQDDPLRSFKI